MSSTNVFHGPGKPIKTKTISQSASDITFERGVCNAIMIDSAGTVTITKHDDATSESFAALAVGIWHPMEPFTKVTACPASSHVGLVE